MPKKTIKGMRGWLDDNGVAILVILTILVLSLIAIALESI